MQMISPNVSEELRWQTVWWTGQNQYVSPQKLGGGGGGGGGGDIILIRGIIKSY